MTGAVQVRGATEADATAIAQVHWDSWVATYTGVLPTAAFEAFPLAARETLWRDTARRMRDEAGSCAVFVADERGQVLGFAAVGPLRANAGMQPSPELGELWAIYVRPGAERRGVGSALWHAGRRWLLACGFAEMRLWVLAGNAAAASFYAARGASRLCGTTFDAHGVPISEDCWALPLADP